MAISTESKGVAQAALGFDTIESTTAATDLTTTMSFQPDTKIHVTSDSTIKVELSDGVTFYMFTTGPSLSRHPVSHS